MDRCRSSEDDPRHTPVPTRPPSTGTKGDTGSRVPADSAAEVSEDRLAGLDAEALHRLAATQPAIEQAKGMLMAYYGLDADAAFALLSRWSSERHVKVRDLSRRLVEQGSAPDAQPFGALRRLLEQDALG